MPDEQVGTAQIPKALGHLDFRFYRKVVGEIVFFLGVTELVTADATGANRKRLVGEDVVQTQSAVAPQYNTLFFGIWSFRIIGITGEFLAVGKVVTIGVRQV